MAANFLYDAFISYRREHESWARRLTESLVQFGVSTWYDRGDGVDGIQVSREWIDEIKSAVLASQTMIVLWSEELANDSSSPVHDEIRMMYDLYEREGHSQRRILPICLDRATIADYPRLARFQADHGLQDLYLKFGTDGAYEVPNGLWYPAIRNTLEAFGIRDVVELRYLGVAMTHQQAKQLWENPSSVLRDTVADSKAFDCLQQLMSLSSFGGFTTERYGDAPDDWKPYPQLSESVDTPCTIRTIFESLDSEKRRWCRDEGHATHWLMSSYSNAVLGDQDDVREDAYRRLLKEACAVIIDPVSLLHKDVYDRLLESSLHNHQTAFVIGVAPFIQQLQYIEKLKPEVEHLIDVVESHLKTLLKSIYRGFCRKYDPGNSVFVLGVDHELQFYRWLQVAVDTIIHSAGPMMLQRRMNPMQRRRIEAENHSVPQRHVLRMANARASW